MPIPIVCLDPRLRQFLAAFRSCFSTPQFTSCETVVFALLLCYESRTLSGLLRCCGGVPQPSGAEPLPGPGAVVGGRRGRHSSGHASRRPCVPRWWRRTRGNGRRGRRSGAGRGRRWSRGT